MNIPRQEIRYGIEERELPNRFIEVGSDVDAMVHYGMVSWTDDADRIMQFNQDEMEQVLKVIGRQWYRGVIVQLTVINSGHGWRDD